MTASPRSRVTFTSFALQAGGLLEQEPPRAGVLRLWPPAGRSSEEGESPVALQSGLWSLLVAIAVLLCSDTKGPGRGNAHLGALLVSSWGCFSVVEVLCTWFRSSLGKYASGTALRRFPTSLSFLTCSSSRSHKRFTPRDVVLTLYGTLSYWVGPIVVNGTCKAGGATFCLFLSLPSWGKHGCRRGI